MKKIFFVTGELSGDRLAAWYLQRLQQQESDLYVEAIGGDFLLNHGAKIYKRFEELNVVGIVEILKHIVRLLSLMRALCVYITQQGFDEVVVVDFPGFNLRLIKKLKKMAPHLKITYLSPPQMWCWGAWRVHGLKRNADRIIVLYPFEVAWYRQRGVHVEWLGTPVAEMVGAHRAPVQEKKLFVALFPGSRVSEIKSLLPLFLRAAALIKKRYPAVQFYLPLAQSIRPELLEAVVQQHHLQDVWQSVTPVFGEEKKYEILQQCCVALTKPGTVTLELALLAVPAVVAYYVPWLTYFLARLVVKVKYMSLPNLIVDREIFKEIIQYDCTSDHLAHELEKVLQMFNHDRSGYRRMLDELDHVVTLITQNQQK